MPSPPPRHQPPPPPHPLKKPTSFPDLILSAFSFFILFSSPTPSSSSSSSSLPPFSLPFRRFFKPPTMSNSPFSSPQSLSNYLKPRLPSDSFASWGVKPGTKNIHNLFLELSQGETILSDSTPPVRTVEVVIVKVIRNDFKVLVESHQELSDGAVRMRGRPLSEKMKPGESVEEAVFRAVKEELGSIVGGVKIVEGSYFKKVEERGSVSYPGLPACYVLHTVEVNVEGLPEGEFSTEEAEGEEYGGLETEGAVSCRKHFWKWVDSDTIG